MTAITHHQPRPGSRLSAVSLLVASAAAGLAVVSLVVAADDDVAEVLPRTDTAAAQAPVVQSQGDPSTIIRAEIDQALENLKTAELADRQIFVSYADIAPTAIDAKDHPQFGSAERVTSRIDAKDHPRYGPAASATNGSSTGGFDGCVLRPLGPVPC